VLLKIVERMACRLALWLQDLDAIRTERFPKM
jgi:hypothetical protein